MFAILAECESSFVEMDLAENIRFTSLGHPWRSISEAIHYFDFDSKEALGRTLLCGSAV